MVWAARFLPRTKTNSNSELEAQIDCGGLQPSEFVSPAFQFDSDSVRGLDRRVFRCLGLLPSCRRSVQSLVLHVPQVRMFGRAGTSMLHLVRFLRITESPSASIFGFQSNSRYFLRLPRSPNLGFGRSLTCRLPKTQARRFPAFHPRSHIPNLRRASRRRLRGPLHPASRLLPQRR